MWRSPARLIRSLTSSASLDVAAGLVLAAWFTGTVLSEHLHPRVVALVCGLGMSLPLLWRRRWPASIGLVVGAAFLAQSWLGVDPQKEIATIVAIFLAAVAHGGIASWRRSLAASALLFALAVLAASGVVFAAVVVAGGWLVGKVLLIRAQESQRLAMLATDNEVRARTAVLEERQRIARELHDVVAHTVSVMVVQAGAASEVMATSPDQAHASLERIQDAGQQALHELRRLLGVLRTEDDEPTSPAPGLSAVPELVQGLRAAGMRVTFSDPSGCTTRLDAGTDLTAYRVVQEALTNALKHGQGDAVDLSIERTGDRVQLSVVGGRSSRAPASGHGLIGMKERVAACGGGVDARPGPDGRFAVTAWLPVAQGVS
ncbi:MAG TPA: histidine kinase [Angustibacter sp.]|nr:histidine kinase [Angustibacter sp.]